MKSKNKTAISKAQKTSRYRATFTNAIYYHPGNRLMPLMDPCACSQYQIYGFAEGKECKIFTNRKLKYRNPRFGSSFERSKVNIT